MTYARRLGEADRIVIGGLGFVFRLEGGETGGALSLVEHPIEPGTLAAPMHTHRREDEFSYVLEGRIEAQVGGEVLLAEAGAVVVKPRNVPHTFWNPGPEPARVLEVISPAGFERYFRELPALFPESGEPDVEGFLALCARYELEMDMESFPRLVEEHGLRPEL